MIEVLQKLAQSNLVDEVDRAVQKFLKMKKMEDRELVTSCIMEAFVQTQLQPVVEIGVQGSDAPQVSLLSSLDHSLPQIRLEGLKALNEMKPGAIPVEFVRSSLLRRLVDDDADVQLEVLKNAELRSDENASDVLTVVERLLVCYSGSPSKSPKKVVDAMIKLVGEHANRRTGVVQVEAMSILLRYVPTPQSKRARRRFQKPAIEALKLLRGPLSKLGDAVGEVLGTDEPDEVENRHTENLLANAIASAGKAAESGELLTLLRKAVERQWAKVETQVDNFYWWWMLLAYSLAVYNKDKESCELANRFAMSILEHSDGGRPPSHPSEESTGEREMEIGTLFEKAADGKERCLQMACGKSFVAVSRILSVTDRSILLRAYTALVRKRLWESAKELLGQKVLHGDRVDFLRASMYTAEPAMVLPESLGILAADAMTHLNGKKDLGTSIVSDIVAFANSSVAMRRAAASRTAAYIVSKLSASKSEAKKLLRIIADQHEKILQSGDTIEELLASFSTHSQAVIVSVYTEASRLKYHSKTAALLRACKRSELKKSRAQEVILCLLPLLRQNDQDLNGATCDALKLFTLDVLPALEKNEEGCCEALCTVASKSCAPTVQQCALQTIERLYADASRKLRLQFFAALCGAMSGKGSAQGALWASDIVLSLKAVSTTEFIAAIEAFPAVQENDLKAQAMKKRKSSLEQNDGPVLFTKASAFAVLELLQKDNAASQIAGSQALIRPLFDLVGKRLDLRRTYEAEEDYADVQYALQLTLNAISSLLLSVPEGKESLKNSDVKSIVNIVQGGDEVSFVINKGAIELLRIVTTMSPTIVVSYRHPLFSRPRKGSPKNLSLVLPLASLHHRRSHGFIQCCNRILVY